MITFEKPSPDLIDAYRKLQDSLGLRTGDRVRVVRTAKTHEGGWSNSWLDSMDQAVGHEFVVGDLSTSGVRLTGGPAGTSYTYPFFVLEILERKLEPFRREIALGFSSAHTAVITKSGVRVGCENFTHSKVKELAAVCAEAEAAEF